MDECFKQRKMGFRCIMHVYYECYNQQCLILHTVQLYEHFFSNNTISLDNQLSTLHVIRFAWPDKYSQGQTT